MKSKAFAFMSYPDSMDNDLIAQHLTNLKIPWRRSPLHDKDVHDKDDPKRGIKAGDPKKPHYHWTIIFPGERDHLVVQRDLGIDGVNHVNNVDDPKAAADYDSHKGFDDKAQYNPDDVVMSNDYPINDLSSYVSARLLDKRKQAKKDNKSAAVLGGTKELIQIMRDGQFREFCDLADFLVDNDRDDLLDLFMSKTYFFDRYLTSYRNAKAVEARIDSQYKHDLEREQKITSSQRESIDSLLQEVNYLKSVITSTLHKAGENPQDGLEDYHRTPIDSLPCDNRPAEI